MGNLLVKILISFEVIEEAKAIFLAEVKTTGLRITIFNTEAQIQSPGFPSLNYILTHSASTLRKLPHRALALLIPSQ